MAYAGRRHRAEGRLAGKLYGQRFGIDVAFAESVVGKPEIVEGTNFLRFAGIEDASYRVYPIESHVAEKLHAYTLPRARPNTRVKDLPDLALLASIREIAAASQFLDPILRAEAGTWHPRRWKWS